MDYLLGMDMMYWVVLGGTMLASWGVGAMLKSKFSKYVKIPIAGGLTGREVAQKMLNDNGIGDVQILCVPGQLTDHYNPTNRTVNLSPAVHDGRCVASAAVAAHEVGHAVQHATAYSMLQMRSKLVPIVSISSKYMQLVILGGFLLLQFSPIPLAIGVILFSMTTLFSFVTLPVEFDASRRALVWIESAGITSSREHSQAKDALKWAAMTYVVAALSSLAMLLYYASLLLRRR